MAELGDKGTLEIELKVSGGDSVVNEINKVDEALKRVKAQILELMKTTGKGLFASSQGIRRTNLTTIGIGNAPSSTGAEKQAAVQARLDNSVLVEARKQLNEAMKQGTVLAQDLARVNAATSKESKVSAEQEIASLKQKVVLLQELIKQENARKAAQSAANKAPQTTDADSQKAWNDFLKQGQTAQREITKIALAETQQRVNLIQNEAKAKEAAVKQAIAYEKEYMAASQSGNKAMSAGAIEAGTRITTLATTIKTLSASSGLSMKQVGQNFVDAGMSANTVNAALKSLTPTAKVAGQSFLDLGRILQITFGISLQQMLQSVINYLKQAAQAGYDFAKSVYQLQIGINAIRRTGSDMTFGDMTENIDALKEKFGTFSTAELMKGSAALINLTRDFGFAKEEVFKLQDAVATLATVNGRAMDDVQRTVALAISSGYTEGLQRLGVSINRVTIALEAERLGFGRNYMSLTEQQRAQATYNILLAKTAVYMDDLASYQKTAPGMVDKLTAAWKDFTAAQGNTLLQLFGGLIGLLANLLNALTWVQQKVLDNFNAVSLFIKGLSMLAAGIQGVINKLDDLGGMNVIEKMVALGKAFQDAARMYNRPKLSEPAQDTGGIKNLVEEAEKSVEGQIEAEEKLVAAIQKAADEIIDITRDAAEKRADLATDLQRDLEDIERDGANKRIEIEQNYVQTVAKLNTDLQADLAAATRDYQYDLQKLAQDTANKKIEIEQKYVQKIAELNMKLQQDLAEARRDYLFDLEKLTIDTTNKRAEIERDYAQQVIDNEQDLQKKLHRLREEFIFDLDEAIRGGDVRQVRKLMRQYEFDKHKVVEDQADVTAAAQREYEQQLADLQRSEAQKREELRISYEQEIAELRRKFQYAKAEALIERNQELAELKMAEAQKRQELLIAYQQKMADIRLQFQQKMAEALIERNQELAELKKALQLEREERLRQYNEQLKDLQLSINRRLKMVAEGFAAEIKYTDAAAKRLAEGLAAAIGPGGFIDKILAYYRAALSRITGTPAPAPSTPDPAKKFAAGGTLLATKPTLAMFGERPELVTFKPLGSNMGSSSPDGGNIGLKIFLSPGLEASIIENTLDKFSKVLLSVERSR